MLPSLPGLVEMERTRRLEKQGEKWVILFGRTNKDKGHALNFCIGEVCGEATNGVWPEVAPRKQRIDIRF